MANQQELERSLEESGMKLANQKMGTSSENEEHREEEPLLYSYYVNPCFNPPASDALEEEDNDNRFIEELNIMRREAYEDLMTVLLNKDLKGRWLLERAVFGLLLAFSRREVGEDVLENVQWTKIMGFPVQVASMINFYIGNIEKKMFGSCKSNLGRMKFTHPPNQKVPNLPVYMPLHGHQQPSPRHYKPGHGHNRNHPTSTRIVVIVRDIPWSIPVEEIEALLNEQAIDFNKVERWRQHLRIEICHYYHYEKLLNEGLNFYNIARFPVSLERSSNSGNQFNGQHDDVLQCYRCQGFWHVALNCKQLPRCVRCGEPHSVEQCFRSRNNAICCNCYGSHHAAYRNCPVRLEVQQSIPVAFTLSSVRPTGTCAETSPTLLTTEPRCHL